MSTFNVTIEKMQVFPHPNADRLELAQIGLYNIVVAKGEWKTGDMGLYIPEYAILPTSLITALGLEGKLSGRNQDRVKPVQLRGELSQGLVAPLSLLPEGALNRIPEGGDFASELGVTKWEPEVPAALSGEVEGNSNLIGWVDIENIKRFPEMFTEGEEIIVDEKIHGTATLFTVINPMDENPKVLVTSKGLGEKKLILKESTSVIYWKAFHNYPVLALTRLVSETFENVTRVGVFGETFGSKIQDLHYGVKDGNNGFRLFDIYFETFDNVKGETGRWLTPAEVETLANKVRMPLVPRLYVGPYSVDKVKELATGMEQVSGEELHIREGVVVRPVNRGETYSTGKAKIGKFVSDAYLTRSNGTEYQ